MAISRRAFLQTSIVGGAALSAFGFDVTPLYAQAKTLKISRTTETRSTCPYCSVSCGVIIHTLGDKAKNVVPQVVHVEGDPDHPINRGTLCPKGASLEQDILNDRRLLKPQVRRPGSDHWEDIGWDQAIDEIAPLGEEDARRDVRREGSRTAAPSTAAKASRGPAAAPTPTNSTISSSRRCAAWGSATWKTRPGFDTGQRSPVWGPHSDAAR